MSEALKENTTLQSLNLHRNSIGDEGAKALSEALKENTTLQSLNLQSNSIKYDGAKALSEALKENTTLQSLDLGGNSIGVEYQIESFLKDTLTRQLTSAAHSFSLMLWDCVRFGEFHFPGSLIDLEGPNAELSFGVSAYRIRKLVAIMHSLENSGRNTVWATNVAFCGQRYLNAVVEWMDKKSVRKYQKVREDHPWQLHAIRIDCIVAELLRAKEMEMGWIQKFTPPRVSTEAILCLIVAIPAYPFVSWDKRI